MQLDKNVILMVVGTICTAISGSITALIIDSRRRSHEAEIKQQERNLSLEIENLRHNTARELEDVRSKLQKDIAEMQSRSFNLASAPSSADLAPQNESLNKSPKKSKKAV